MVNLKSSYLEREAMDEVKQEQRLQASIARKKAENDAKLTGEYQQLSIKEQENAIALSQQRQ